MKEVFKDIKNERKSQDKQWGGYEHDDSHTHEEFLGFIHKQLNLTFFASDYKEVRKRFVKIAALAVASVESIDRKATNEVNK